MRAPAGLGTERRAKPAGRIQGEFRAPLLIQVRAPAGLGTERRAKPAGRIQGEFRAPLLIQVRAPAGGLGETLWVGTSTTSALSLGRVGPAPHTQHLLGPFAAIAQNSSLWSFSTVDSLANRQHSCRGSEELAIRKTARFQATPSYFTELRATPSYSELLSAIRIGSTKLPGNRRKLGTSSFELRATPSYSELPQATPSHSERLQEFLKLSERLLRVARAFRARKKLRRLPSYSEFELGAPKNSELLRGELHRTLSGNCPRRQPDRIRCVQELRATNLRA